MLKKYLLESLESNSNKTAVVDSFCLSITYGELLKIAKQLACEIKENHISNGPIIIFDDRRVKVIVHIVAAILAERPFVVINEALNLQSISDKYGFDEFVSIVKKPESYGCGKTKWTHTDISYICFTSGTTGKPKGVCIKASSLVHYVKHAQDILLAKNIRKIGHVNLFSTDLGHTSVFLSLLNGLTLDICSESARTDVDKMRNFLINSEVDFVKTTPTHYREVFPKDVQISCLVLGGEPLYVSQAREIIESKTIGDLFNHYGPTETTIGVCALLIDLSIVEQIKSGIVPFGYPFGQNKYELRAHKDNDFELVIFGPQVFSCYLNEAEVELHATGDLVEDIPGIGLRWKGRIDNQFKVNGFRISIDSIEQLVKAKFGLAFCACLLIEVDGRNKLCIVMPISSSLAKLEILQFVQVTFSVNIVPIFSEGLPFKISGKVDKDKLKLEFLDRVIEGCDDLDDGITSLWIKSFNIVNLDDHYSSNGADSIDAIRFITKLQRLGYKASLDHLQKKPTFNSFKNSLVTSCDENDLVVTTKSYQFTRQQREYLSNYDAYGDWFNQSVALYRHGYIEPSYAINAVEKIINTHTSLRTAYLREQTHTDSYAWFATIIDSPTDGLFEFHLSTYDPLRIKKICDEARKSICLSKGRLFKVIQIYISEKNETLFIFIVNHICIDGISWRIIIDDFVSLVKDDSYELLSPSTNFLDYVQKDEDTAPLAIKVNVTQLEQSTNENISEYWLLFSKSETLALEKLLNKSAKKADQYIIQCIINTLQETTSIEISSVTTESHGRSLSCSETHALVGWFTKTNSYNLSSNTNEGIKVCFNHLGSFDIDDVDWGYSTLVYSDQRNFIGPQAFDLLITSKIVEGKLSICLSYNRNTIDFTTIEPSVSRIRSRITSELKVNERAVKIFRKNQISIGNLTFCPEKSDEPINNIHRNEYGSKKILLLGATGFLGAHFLINLAKANANVFCIVRDKDTQYAEERLSRVISRYSSGSITLSDYSNVKVFCGDLEDSKFGLSQNEFTYLECNTDIVINAAADVNLVQKFDFAKARNLDVVERVVDFCLSSKKKELHHISTTAVAGYIATDNNLSELDECNLFIGQSFRNSYEKSKAHAEHRIRESAASSMSNIYRVGSLTSSREYGIFQENYRSNRIFHELLSYLRLGMLPDDIKYNLAHVDDVVVSILKVISKEDLSLTFNIDQIYSIDAKELMNLFRSVSVQLNIISKEEFSHVLNSSFDSDVINSIFWHNRVKSNVTINSHWTHRYLTDNRTPILRLCANWFCIFFKNYLEDYLCSSLSEYKNKIKG